MWYIAVNRSAESSVRRMDGQFKLGDLIAQKYRLERPLGEGAYGAVWKANYQKLRRSVAIKFLKSSVLEADADRRFEREAKALGRLDHRNCVVLYDYGHHEDQAFLVTEFVDGETLHTWAQREQDLVEILDVIYQLLDALVHAHQMSVIHRDLKPGNVLLTRDLDDALCVKVLDFGISSVVGEKRGDITKTGELFGTPGYMSPEQLTGENVGARSDLYSLGVILFYLIERKAPFVAKTQIEAALKHLTHEAPALEREVPDGLRVIVARLLEKDPDARFPSARAVQAALRDLPIARQSAPLPPAPLPLPPAAFLTPRPTEPEPIRQPPRPIVVEDPPTTTVGWTIAAVVLVLATFAYFVFAPAEPDAPVPPSPTRIAAALRTAEVPPPTAAVAPASDAGRADANASRGLSAGCGGANRPTGLQTISVVTGLDEDNIQVYVPSTYDPNTPHPFVLIFHDTLQTPRMLLDQTGFAELADRDGFVLVLPEHDTMFNAWHARKEHRRARRELDVVASELCLDLDQMHLYGHGGGGYAAEEIACAATGVQAVAVSAHRLGEGESPCKHPDVRYLLLAPLHDERDPVAGGVGCLGGAKISLAAHEAAYRRIHGCGDTREVVFRRGNSQCFTWDCVTPFTSCHIDGGRPLPGGTPNVECEGKAASFPYGQQIWTFFSPPS